VAGENKLRGLIVSAGVLLALLAAACFIYDYWRDHRYDADIARAAKQHGLSPFLVKAVVWRESRFNTFARGSKDEIGLMQVRPATAAEWAKANRQGAFNPQTMTLPATGLDVGCWCLRRAMDRWRSSPDPVPYALAEYNAGRSNALRWAAGLAARDPQRFRAGIAYPGTRAYVRAIEDRCQHYKQRGRL
jgi:soluble lytic murein transglycosylase